MTSFIGKQEYHLYLFLTQEWVAEGHRHWPTRCNIFARSILKDIYLSAFIKLNFVRDKKNGIASALFIFVQLGNHNISCSDFVIFAAVIRHSTTLHAPCSHSNCSKRKFEFYCARPTSRFCSHKMIFYFATLRPAWDMFLSHLSSAWTILRDLELPWLKNIKAAF